MSERKAVTKKLALEYRRGGRACKGQILDELCRLTEWHRSHARKALKQTLVLKAVKPRPPRCRIWFPDCAGSASSTSTMTRPACC